jgi:hypothetical protein
MANVLDKGKQAAIISGLAEASSIRSLAMAAEIERDFWTVNDLVEAAALPTSKNCAT